MTVPRIPLRYRAGLFLVAVAMVLLPLIYLGLIGVVGWGGYLYATHGIDWFFPLVGGSRRVHYALMMLYAAPILVGALLILFLIKPLFTRWEVLSLSFPLRHEDNPELFALIGRICQALGAPIPSRVDVDFHANAHARFRAGLASFFSNDIMITFGLPLAAGLNAREFAGVIAHELAHVSQRAALRCGYVIDTVNGWFGRVVYQRDDLDEWLEEETNSSAFTLVAFGLARIGIALGRGLFWLLMMAGHFLSSFLSRQMEYHADDCALVIVGSESYLAMARRVHVLAISSATAMQRLKRRVDAKLPDDFSTYIAAVAAQCTGESQGRLHQQAQGSRARWFHSHPSNAERTAHARAANAAGLIEDTRPATALFGNFRELSRALTLQGYEWDLERRVSADDLFPVTAAERAVPDTSAEETAIKEYFRGLGFILHPLALDERAGKLLGFPSTWVQQHRDARAALEAAEISPLREALKAADATLLQALQADALAEAGAGVQADLFPLLPAGRAGDPELVAELRHALAEAERKIEPRTQTARTRLSCALQLLRTPAVAAAIPNTQQIQDEVTSLLHVLARVSEAFPALLELRREFSVLPTLLALRPQAADAPNVEPALHASVERAQSGMARIQQALGSASHPFTPDTDNLPLVDYARTKEFDADPARMVAHDASSHVEMLFALYYQVLARLVAIARQVEQQLDRAATDSVP